MAEVFTGKLIAKDDKKGRRWFLAYTSKKGAAMNEPISPDKFARSLRDSKESEIEVGFELNDSGRPFRICPAGEDWQEPAPARNQPDNQLGMNNMLDQAIKREFHNPYNFVPAPERRKNTKLIEGELGDREPSGHDRFLADKFGGKLRVRMTVETPLLLPDTARVGVGEVGDDAHKSFPVRVKPLLDEQGNEVKDATGKTIEVPDINPTAVKGMLRSAYEAITNSRLSVFHKHDKKLAFRMDAREGLQSIPAIVKPINNGAEIELLTGTVESSKIGNDGKPHDGEPMYAGWLLSYGNFGTYRGTHGKHGEKVWAYIVLDSRRRRFNYWKVEKLEDGNLPKPLIPPGAVNPGGRWVKGHVCITEKNIERKHDERIFFNENPSPIPLMTVTGDEWKRLRDGWRRLIEDYAETDHSGKPAGVELSRHIKRADTEKKLENETLCYARVEKIGGGWRVKELIPVMISRRLHEVAPAELLPDELQPAQTLAELSPADRVFGWVRQSGGGTSKELTKEEKKFGAYRGQIRIGAVNLAQDNPTANGIDDFNGETVPLQILGQPKPQQGRFYVARDKDGNAQPKILDSENGLTNERAGYNKPDKKGLRGRKVYPHHEGLPSDYWDEPWRADLKTSLANYFREYRRPESNKVRDKQNRTIKGWIKPQTVFEFDIRFTNLSDVELGALIWLVDLNRYANANGESKRFFHRFGGGKPLGFGSVNLRLEATDIRKGEHWREFYQSLDDKEKGKLDDVAIEKLASDFKGLVESTYPTILKSFLRAAEGFVGTKLPIHYPRARHFVVENNRVVKYVNEYDEQVAEDAPVPPHDEGLAYEWFVENAKEKIEVRDQGEQLDIFPATNPGLEEMFPRYALPDLAKDEGLPIWPHKKSQGT